MRWISTSYNRTKLIQADLKFIPCDRLHCTAVMQIQVSVSYLLQFTNGRNPKSGASKVFVICISQGRNNCLFPENWHTFALCKTGRNGGRKKRSNCIFCLPYRLGKQIDVDVCLRKKKKKRKEERKKEKNWLTKDTIVSWRTHKTQKFDVC